MAGDRPHGPVFIAGCGRSGTTYLRTLLDAHPDIVIPPESLFLTDYLEYGAMLPRSLRTCLLLNEPQLKEWYDGPRIEVLDVVDSVIAVHEHLRRKERAKIWGQKTPRFVRHMGLFDSHIQGIKWILMYRDPRAVVLSMLRSKQHTYSIRRACKRWVRDNRHIIEARGRTKSDNAMVVKYEDLIASFDDTMAAVLEFIGVAPVSAEAMVAAGRPQAFRTAQFDNNAVRDGLRPQARLMDRWKDALPTDEIALIERMCGREMEALGYARMTDAGGPAIAAASVWTRDTIRGMSDIAIVLEYLQRWPRYLAHTIIRKAVMGGFRALRTVICWR